eukprot:132641_1
MASDQKATDNANTTFTFKKFMGNVASTAKLFTAPDPTPNEAPKPTKTMQDLEDEIEILKLQKDDLRLLVQERTYKLDQLQKLDTEHQKVRQRWKQNEEKATNDVANISSYSGQLKQQLKELKAQNAMLQSKQTNNDLIKNKLENQLRGKIEHEQKTKKLLERTTQEKKMLVGEVLKLRDEKQDLLTKYKNEIDKLNTNNTHNIDQLTELNNQTMKRKEMEYSSQINGLNRKYDELHTLYTNYKQRMADKIANIDSTTNAFEVMINNANIGNLTEGECDRILDNIIHSIEDMERENEKYRKAYKTDEEEEDDDDTVDDPYDDSDEYNELKKEVRLITEDDVDEAMVLNKIESRMLKSLREKALLQKVSNQFMAQLQELQTQHEEALKAKDEIIQKYEIRAKVKFFKKRRQSKAEK